MKLDDLAEIQELRARTDAAEAWCAGWKKGASEAFRERDEARESLRLSELSESGMAAELDIYLRQAIEARAESERLLVLLDRALDVIPDGYAVLRDDVRAALDAAASPAKAGGAHG